jgi:sialate O-acetylesterase
MIKLKLMFFKQLYINKYLLFFLISFVQLVSAEVKLPAIVSSNMVLQRNANVSIWGWADAYEEITIKASWLDKVEIIKADSEGNWRIIIKTTNSKEPQTININTIKLDNILFGEVWLCSGQSNMFQPVKGYTGQPTFGSAMAIAKSNNPSLRLFSVDKIGSKQPLIDLKGFTSWQQASPENVANFSAVGYFFAEQLQQILDVPVGIIHTSWGASKVEAWISNEVMSSFQEVTISDKDILNRSNRTPTALFNAMINPLIPYTIKGALWYQGEGNRNEPEKYKKLLPAMVKDWRTRWGIGDFPFYYVQIAPYSYGNLNAYDDYKNTAFMREAQLQCLDLIPNSGITITMDIGDADFIHPPKKKEVADRLLFNALNKTYGFKNIDYTSPIYDSSVVKDGSLIISFKNSESGLYTFDKLEDFEIAGDDRVFYPAIAKIVKGKSISVSSDKVPNPVAVRYAWKNWVNATLFGTNLIPVSSFRTDNWKDAKQSKN